MQLKVESFALLSLINHKKLSKKLLLSLFLCYDVRVAFKKLQQETQPGVGFSRKELKVA
jgi:hypothetical protein